VAGGRKDIFFKEGQMKYIVTIAAIAFIFYGCDMTTKEIPPDQLPPVPEQCTTLSDQHTRALTVAYTSAEASQLQVARIANQFAQCMEEAGLSRNEAKGIIKNQEKTVREQADKGGGQHDYIYR
jgi:hypothetical protein